MKNRYSNIDSRLTTTGNEEKMGGKKKKSYASNAKRYAITLMNVMRTRP